jgi:hypothetical protein
MDMNLSEKLARWVPKLLNDDIKQLKTSEELLAMDHHHAMSMLDNIVIMDESVVSFDTPETKQQSKQTIAGEGQARADQDQSPCHYEEANGAGFLRCQGPCLHKLLARGENCPCLFIIEALTQFLKVLKQKRPVIVARDWWFHLDNAPVYTATVVTNWMVARQLNLIKHPPYFLIWHWLASFCSAL